MSVPDTAIADRPASPSHDARGHAVGRPAAASIGLRLRGATAAQIEAGAAAFMQRLTQLGVAGLARLASGTDASGAYASIRLSDAALDAWAPAFDTTRLCQTFGLDTQAHDDDLEREIVLALLAAPQPFDFPSHDELDSAIRIRANIVRAARPTELAFHTTEVNRPVEFWSYREGEGFTLNPGKRLIDALQKALHPEPGGPRYAFSCYRATEYVMLLGIAQELQRSHPALLHALEERWRISPIASRQFHDTFLREHGSTEQPLPFNFYVPGDRVWFRNPDEASADVAGFEGSWVIYLGNGRFANFWDANRPFTLASKCEEIYHWRHAVRRDESGEPYIDETIVTGLLRGALRRGDGLDHILERMARYRDVGGVYQDGGCMDHTREAARWVRPGSCDLLLPALS